MVIDLLLSEFHWKLKYKFISSVYFETDLCVQHSFFVI